MEQHQTSIPTGSTILITGVSGYVASQVAKQFLQRGFKVRGTVRDLVRASWLVNNVFKSYADNGTFELVKVDDITSVTAFDDAMKGVSAVAHLASPVTLASDPSIMDLTVAAATCIMKAAAKEPSVKELLYTSSIVASILPKVNDTTHVDRNSWNVTALKLAADETQHDAVRGVFIYQASKVRAEQAVWKFVEEQKPHYAVNTICPAIIMGEALDKSHVQSPAHWMKHVYQGNVAVLKPITGTYYVDIKDIALLVAATILDPAVRSERLQAWGPNGNWNDVLAIARSTYPDMHFMDDFPDQTTMSLTADMDLQVELLKKWGSQHGWTPMESIIKDNLRGAIAWLPRG